MTGSQEVEGSNPFFSTKKIDTIFSPNNYNADDAKVMFHPVDFLIFNGMKEKNSIDNLVLYDREVRDAAQKVLQKSITKTVEKENYEWSPCKSVRMVQLNTNR